MRFASWFPVDRHAFQARDDKGGGFPFNIHTSLFTLPLSLFNLHPSLFTLRSRHGLRPRDDKTELGDGSDPGPRASHCPALRVIQSLVE